MESDNKINKKDINIEIDSDDMDYSFSSSESSIEEKDDSKKINEALLEKEEMSEQEKISEKI